MSTTKRSKPAKESNWIKELYEKNDGLSATVRGLQARSERKKR